MINAIGSGIDIAVKSADSGNGLSSLSNENDAGLMVEKMGSSATANQRCGGGNKEQVATPPNNNLIATPVVNNPAPNNTGSNTNNDLNNNAIATPNVCAPDNSCKPANNNCEVATNNLNLIATPPVSQNRCGVNDNNVNLVATPPVNQACLATPPEFAPEQSNLEEMTGLLPMLQRMFPNIDFQNIGGTVAESVDAGNSKSTSNIGK